MTKGILSYKGTPKEVSKYLSEISKKGAESRRVNYWGKMTEQERSAEMSRRRRKGMEKD